MSKIMILAAMAAMCVTAIGADRPPAPDGGRPGASGVRQRQGVRQRNGKAMKRGKDESRMSRQDQSIIESIEDAETVTALSRLLPNVCASRSVEVRQAMVDALSDHGRKAVNELAYFIADSDDDVAESAFTAWTFALGECNAASRAAAICAAASILQQHSAQGGRNAHHGQGMYPQRMPSQGQMTPNQGGLPPQGQMAPNQGEMPPQGHMIPNQGGMPPHGMPQQDRR